MKFRKGGKGAKKEVRLTKSTLLLNFGEALMKDGISRAVNGLEDD